MTNEIALRPSYWASVSGGKDSLYMLNLILHNLDKYPLSENGITEDEIWEWAKTVPIFNHYYEVNKRCGCMYCPMSSYLYKYYPANFSFMLEKMRETETKVSRELGRPFSVISSNPKYNSYYLENIIKTKWLPRLNEMEGGICQKEKNRKS